AWFGRGDAAPKRHLLRRPVLQPQRAGPQPVLEQQRIFRRVRRQGGGRLMAGWFVADADGYGVRFVGGEDEPELEPGETADYYGIGLDEQEVRASLRRSVAGQQIGIGDGETTQFEVPGAPVAHGTLTLYLDGDPVDPEDYLWNPEGGSIVFEDEDYDPDEPDPSKRHPPPAGAVLTADYICLGR